MSEEPTVISRPLIIVEATERGTQKYHVFLSHLDQFGSDTRAFGIILSDLADHIAMAYHQSTGRDVKDIKAELVKIMRDEDRFKERDPKRGNLTGHTDFGNRN